MHPDSVRFALGGLLVSLCEATELATGKPVGQLVGYLMEKMASSAEPEAAELCAFLACCADPRNPTGARPSPKVISGGAA